MTEDKKKTTVEVSPESFVSMVLHAGENPTTVVHGLLMGSFKGDKILVTKAIPVCHETPTKPLLETALGLAGALSEETVVGWYTAPERLTDTHPGPVALRIAANMATDKTEPVLIVLDNEGLAACLTGDSSASVLKGLGKDFGQQWLEPLSLKVTNESKASAAASSAFKGAIQVVDLVNHLEDAASSDWFSNTALTNHVAKVAN